MKRKGRLEIVTGCMFSGKTSELLRRLERVRIARKDFALFKPLLDDRRSPETVSTHPSDLHGTLELPAVSIPADVRSYSQLQKAFEPGRLESCSVVGFDEGNFFSDQFVDVCTDLVERGKTVIVAGLDLTFRERPFGCMHTLMALADEVNKLTAVCVKCGAIATRSQRLIAGALAPSNGPEILVGGSDSYEARCRDCFVSAWH